MKTGIMGGNRAVNVYAVISEPLSYQEIIDPEIGGPWEEYRIAEIVAAPTRGRAKWLAWKSDEFDLDGIRDMPKFSVRLIRKNEGWPEGLLTEQEHLWAWGMKRPWLQPEALLVENFLALYGEAETSDDGVTI